MTYYLQDRPNPNTPQFGWQRTKVSGVIGVHTAENNTDFDGADPGAEDVARFIGRRTDYGSYHAIADADSRIKLVHPSYSAWADTTNNPHAMSVSGAMQAARWRELTPERAAALTRNMAYAAAELVQDAIAAGLLAAPTPARRITPAEAIAGSRAGFYGHGETNPGRRYDPGQNFDWDLFLATYAGAVGGGIAPQGTTTPQEPEEDDMPTAADLLYEPVPKYDVEGNEVGTTSLAETIAWNEANFLRQRQLTIDGIKETVLGVLTTQLTNVATGGTTSLATEASWAAWNAKREAQGGIDANAVADEIAKAIAAKLTAATVTKEMPNG